MGLAALVAAGLPWSAAHAEPIKRHQVDAQEMTNERVLRPHVADLIEQGEAALEKCDLENAVEFFRRATEGSPHGALAYRRQCQALTALGRRDEAMAACQKAVANQGSGMDLRAYVAAIVSAPPTSTELANAFGLAKRARDIMPLEPWGYAAQCDIARRLGDIDMLNQSFEELRHVAPDHDETERVAAVLAAARHPWRFAIAWATIGLLFLATIVHAVRQSARRAREAAVAIAILASTVALSSRAYAEDGAAEGRRAGSLSQWQINDADPVASVPPPPQRDANPLEYGYFIMDLSDRADQATRRGDHAAAVKYWEALVKAVPDRSIGYSKLCESYEALGDWEKAVGACKATLYHEGVLVKDYARLVAVVLEKRKPLEVAEVEDLDKILERVRKMESGREVADELSCDIGVRLGDVPRLDQCTRALAASAPDHPRTIYFQWTLALLKKNYDEARRLIVGAKAAGTSPERLQQMEKATTAASSVWQRMKRRWPIAGGGVLVAFIGIALTLRAARRTARTCHTHDTTDSRQESIRAS